MIENWIVSKLDTLAALNHQVYPPSTPIGGAAPPFAVYTRENASLVVDLSGGPVLWTDRVKIVLFDDDADRLYATEAEVEKLMTVTQEDGGDIYIFSAMAQQTEPDGMDLSLELLARTVTVTIRYWR